MTHYGLEQRLWRVAPKQKLTKYLLQYALAKVNVECELPDGTVLNQQLTARPRIQIQNQLQLFKRLASHPKIGIGEGYMAGDWGAAPGTDLADLLLPFAENITNAVPGWAQRTRRVVEQAIPETQRNTQSGSKQNISSHYDLSNEMFAHFLDPTMTYSSAVFADYHEDLATAQVRKIDHALDLAGVKAGSKVLEIGTGWGQLAIQAARRGAQIDTITLSAEQAQLAQERVDAAGLTNNVRIKLVDYREVTGSYDAVVSIEMIEAVGEEFWPTYFKKIDQLLRPDGVAVIQAILMSHPDYLRTRKSYGWIQKYIFPGGLIPSETAIAAVLASHTGLKLRQRNYFGQDYAETLRRWRQSFVLNWPQIQSLGFDQTFFRMWEFYLAYCEAGFKSGYLDVAQLRIQR